MSKKKHIDENKSLKKVAHDINNILTAVINSAENLIFISSLADEQLSLVNDIKRNTSLASQLITEQLLKKTSKNIYKEHIKLNKFFNDLSMTLSHILKKGVSFIQNNNDDKLSVLANYNDLFRVLLNLCTNANDAIESKGQIEIDYQLVAKDELKNIINDDLQFESYCKITVKDNGKGIEKKNLSRIFDEGFSTKDKGHESGFGLNIAKEIINNHNGFIFVNSRVGIGTTFEIFLPSFIENLIKKKKSKIVIADDEAPVRESLSELLEGYNYEVIQANNGKEVLNLFRDDDQINLLIIDKNMPVTNGIDCIKKIKDNKYRIKIILVTGNELDEEEVTELNEMVDKIIPKPYNFYELLNDIVQLTKTK